MKSIIQCYSSEVKYSSVKDLVDELAKMFKKSLPADGGEASGSSGSPISSLKSKVIKICSPKSSPKSSRKKSTGKESPKSIGKSSPKSSPKRHTPTKHDYSNLTSENKKIIDRAKRSFEYCLLEGDVDLPEVKAIMDQTGHEKLTFALYVDEHPDYIFDVGYARGFVRLMRLIFEHLMQPRKTIGIPNEFMEIFIKLSKKITTDYDIMKSSTKHNGFSSEDELKDLAYIEYYAVVLTYMITVQVDAP